MHEGNAIAIVLPQKVTLEVTDTEPTTKGQTASSSYKPRRCRTAYEPTCRRSSGSERASWS